MSSAGKYLTFGHGTPIAYWTGRQSPIWRVLIVTENRTYKSDPATADDKTQQNSDEWEREHGDESKAPEDQSDQSKPDMGGERK